MKPHEEDRPTKKGLDLYARSRITEEWTEPLMDLIRTLRNLSKTSIFSNYESHPHLSKDRKSETFEAQSIFLC